MPPTCVSSRRTRLQGVAQRPVQRVVGRLLPARPGGQQVRPLELLDLGDRVGPVVLGVPLDRRRHQVVAAAGDEQQRRARRCRSQPRCRPCRGGCWPARCPRGSPRTRGRSRFGAHGVIPSRGVEIRRPRRDTLLGRSRRRAAAQTTARVELPAYRSHPYLAVLVIDLVSDAALRERGASFAAWLVMRGSGGRVPAPVLPEQFGTAAEKVLIDRDSEPRRPYGGEYAAMGASGFLWALCQGRLHDARGRVAIAASSAQASGVRWRPS